MNVFPKPNPNDAGPVEVSIVVGLLSVIITGARNGLDHSLFQMANILHTIGGLALVFAISSLCAYAVLMSIILIAIAVSRIVSKIRKPSKTNDDFI